VILFFNLRRPLGHADHTRIANAVVQVVAGNMPADGDTVELEGRPGQPPEVDLILVNRRYPRDLGRWGCMELHAIERNISCIVQKSITKKTDRLPMYRACDECWLLLVGDSFVASGNLEVGEAFDTNAFSTPFGRTYFLDFGRGYLYRLDESGRFAKIEPPANHRA
jgi:hypothetical protein